ncbi:TRAP transporter large permease [Calderihabitans maritimus]|uniref:TRAP C4-dicarboxylate transport system permease DctM subunit domain-containing protein n=1 Tax=Calderihabitans maritimus TaxID=1246530 RepID=A0A1Z5HWY9_9FIRM|nr:TRAP transporter large permease [Calderihabitans maritimus]GAW93800.1 hypothetical protein KKC1_29270 [Calderihabitans maritimus]
MLVAVAFVLFFVIGIPVVFVLGLTGLVHILLSGETAFMMQIPRKLFNAIDNFNLMAIPFFMLAGELMNHGGIADRLIRLAKIFVGRVRGGLAYVNILASMLLAAIMGSATAEASAMSSIMVPAMEREGYDRDFSAAVTVAASIMGPIIPPSMVFIIYGVSAGASIGNLFLAGIVPGVLLAIGGSAVVYFVSKKRNFPIQSDRISAAEAWEAIKSAAPSLLVPVIIVGGILTGAFTPTESAVIASAVAFILGFFFYKELKPRDIFTVLLNTGVTSAAIILIMSTAGIFGWTLAIQQVPQKIAEMILSVSNNPIVVLILINILMLVIGMFMETLAAIIILVPVFLPIINYLNIDPIHFGLVISLNAVIGLITPPVGLCLFIGSSIGKVPVERISRAVIPFVVSSVAVLLIVTYFPDLVLYIPRLFFN